MRRIKSRRSRIRPIFIAMVGRSSPMVVDDLGHRSPADRRSIEVDAVPPARVSAQAPVFDDVGDPHRGDQCDERGAGSLCHVRGTGPEPAGRRQARAGRWSPAASDEGGNLALAGRRSFTGLGVAATLHTRSVHAIYGSVPSIRVGRGPTAVKRRWLIRAQAPSRTS